MSEIIKEKLPQNINHLLMEIGEKMVLFRLYLLIKDTSWEVFQNLGDAGCDVVLLDKENNNKIKVEVKTRQRIYSISDKKRLNYAHFTVSENEYKNCDFVVCYWLENNDFFIVPKAELKETSSNGKLQYKFIVRKLSDGSYDKNSLCFLEQWNLII